MKSLSPVLSEALFDNLLWAMAPEYLVQVEAAGNIVPYRNYLSGCMLDVHSKLSHDSESWKFSMAINNIYYNAPWFN